LAQESACVLRLQEELIQYKEDLRNEKNTSRNVESSLDNAHSKLKEKDTEIRDLEAALERLSGTSNGYNDRGKALEHEKSVLESRNHELESEIRQLRSSIAANSRRAPSRTSSAKFNDLKIIALEKETEELREKLSQKENESVDLRTKLSLAQGQVLRLENEAQAKETRVKTEVHEMQMLLQEREEELEFYKSQPGGSEREEELLQRIGEDEAKIIALEAMLAKTDDVRDLKEKLRNVERRLKVEVDKVANLESQNTNILRERDDAFTNIDNMQDELRILKIDTQEQEEEIDGLRLERYDFSIL
jgi:chromosome segregation ATPase